MLSLCVIARDEAALLPGLLASVEGAVDEIVLLDTGSTDDTRAVAAAAGARVHERPWDDDFAAARNACLDAARGDWILVLDADERLHGGAALRRFVADGDADAGLLRLHNADRVDAPAALVLAGRARLGTPTALPRMFRRDPGLRWRGRVHEGVGAWLAGKRIGPVDADIVHLGYAPELRQARDKNSRDLALLTLRTAEEPHNPTGWGYLAEARARVGDIDGAFTAAERGFAVLPAAVARGGLRPSMIRLLTLRVQTLLQRGRAREACDAVAQIAALSQPHPNLWWLDGRSCLWAAIQAAEPGAGALERARAALQRALDAHGQTFTERVSPGATSWAAREDLALVEILAGDPAAALVHARAALADNADSIEAALLEVEALQGLDPGGASAALERLSAAHPGCPDARWLQARDALARRDLRGAADALGAMVRAEGPWRAPHRPRQAPALVAALKAAARRP